MNYMIVYFLLAWVAYWYCVRVNSRFWDGWISKKVSQKYSDMKVFPGKTEWEADFKALKILTPLKILSFFRCGGYVAIFFFAKPVFEAPILSPLIWGIVSLFLFVWWWDLAFYLAHRFLFHSRWGFKKIHYVHHKFRDPVVPVRVAFSVFEFAALEIFGVLPLLLFPVPVAAAIIGREFLLNWINILNHLGYETFPSGFVKHPIFKWMTTSTHHSMHHSKFNWNYSLFVNYDLLLGTQEKNYEDEFEKIKSRKNDLQGDQIKAVK